MKLLHYNMYNRLKYTFTVGLFFASIFANAQVTIQSPYSKYGVGNLKGTLLPQLRAMGGASTAIYKPSFFNNINMQNPASYAGINTATLDMGMSGSFTTLKNSNQKENSFNGTLSHVALAFNVTTKSALSFGILPYSELGYNFKNTTTLGSKTVDYKYNGEGGLSKAYLGYGFQIGDHLRLGANAEYLFGSLSEAKSTELVNDPGAINSRIQSKNTVGGVSFSYGAQYDFRLKNKVSLVLGYSGSSSSSINSKKTQIVTQYTNDALGNELPATDTLSLVENNQANLKLPLTHNIGISLQKDNKWLIAADYRMGKWSNYSVANVNQGLQDTYGFSVGGQFTPDVTAINGYFKRVDYRLGFQYDKTYIQTGGKDVLQTAITAGLGLPLSSYARGAFYKMNVTAELGQRGPNNSGLLQEKYFKLHLAFTLNDGSWFRRFKFD